MAGPLVLFCASIVLVSVAGGALPLAAVVTHTRLQLYLSFAAGVMLGAAFLHMLPEAVEADPGSIPWAAAGLLSLFLLERFFSFHHHEPEDAVRPLGHDHHHHAGHQHHSTDAGKRLHWGAAAFGLAVHSVVGGVALASAVASDEARYGRPGAAAWGVFLATLLHKPADALTVVSLMIRGGIPLRRAHVVNLGFAMMIPLGAVVFALGVGGLEGPGASRWTAALLSFSAGTFLCISLSDILPELQFHHHDRVKLSAALLLGFLLMALTMSGHVHHEAEPAAEAGHLEP